MIYRWQSDPFFQMMRYPVVIFPCMFLFLMLRLRGRLCISAVDESALPNPGPLTILQLIYWTAGFAVFFAAAPIAVRSVAKTYLPMAKTPSLIFYLFLPQIIVLSSMLLAFALTRKLAAWKRWPFVAGIGLLLNYAVSYYFAWRMNSPVNFEWFNEICFAVVHACAVSSAFWLATRGGGQLKRFPK